MRAWPNSPVVHEIFTWVWLAELGERAGRGITLADVPDEVWDDVARPGIDAVWLMGVWQRSPMGAQIARSHPGLAAAHQAALPGFTDADVVGSAYCVRDYVVDRRLGGEDGLATARAQLARRGVRLVLDLVPNHVAPDHRWAREHPEFFIQGTPADLEREPHAFLRIGDRVLACGRDPYFPAWPEVLQLDASHVGLRAAMAELVSGLARRCDGVRCDMAMLLLDDVFARTWGDRASGGPRPDGGRGFWPTIIGATKAARPDFVFWAEAYWDLEPVLLEQGFDACYDKRLYDRLVHGGAIDVGSVRAHLGADVSYQRRMIRFVENHDEPRAASVLSPAAHRAALATVFTLPGVALLHEGEADGRRVRVPVTLGRRPVEEPDLELRAFVERLVAALAGGLRRGAWSLVAVWGWPDNPSAERLLAWSWTDVDHRHLVIVNLSEGRADGRAQLPWTDLDRRTILLTDVLSGQRFERDGSALARDGLYVALDGHAMHVFEVT
ncbi:MAG TPA: alpha-amylase family glycosyl hydrolase [Kofleriaceae bacterium]